MPKQFNTEQFAKVIRSRWPDESSQFTDDLLVKHFMDRKPELVRFLDRESATNIGIEPYPTIGPPSTTLPGRAARAVKQMFMGEPERETLTGRVLGRPRTTDAPWYSLPIVDIGALAPEPPATMGFDPLMPIKTAAEFASDVVSPLNIGIMAVTGGTAGAARAALSKAVARQVVRGIHGTVGLGFGAHMTKGAYDIGLEAKQAAAEGDFKRARKLRLQSGMSLGFAGLAAAHGAGQFRDIARPPRAAPRQRGPGRKALALRAEEEAAFRIEPETRLRRPAHPEPTLEPVSLEELKAVPVDVPAEFRADLIRRTERELKSARQQLLRKENQLKPLKAQPRDKQPEARIKNLEGGKARAKGEIQRLDTELRRLLGKPPRRKAAPKPKVYADVVPEEAAPGRAGEREPVAREESPETQMIKQEIREDIRTREGIRKYEKDPDPAVRKLAKEAGRKLKAQPRVAPERVRDVPEPAPSRTFKMYRGMHGPVDVEFPSIAHADLFAFSGRVKRSASGEKAFDAAENARYLQENLGLTEVEFRRAAIDYRQQVLDAIKPLERETRYKAPRLRKPAVPLETPEPSPVAAEPVTGISPEILRDPSAAGIQLKTKLTERGLSAQEAETVLSEYDLIFGKSAENLKFYLERPRADQISELTNIISEGRHESVVSPSSRELAAKAVDTILSYFGGKAKAPRKPAAVAPPERSELFESQRPVPKAPKAKPAAKLKAPAKAPFETAPLPEAPKGPTLSDIVEGRYTKGFTEKQLEAIKVLGQEEGRIASRRAGSGQLSHKSQIETLRQVAEGLEPQNMPLWERVARYAKALNVYGKKRDFLAAADALVAPSTEAGFASHRGRLTTKSPFHPLTALQRARKFGITASIIRKDMTTELAGWLSPDGKVFISAEGLPHQDIMSLIVRGKLTAGSADLYAALENGWIRKAQAGAYYISEGALPQVLRTVQSDILRAPASKAGRIYIDIIGGPAYKKAFDSYWFAREDLVQLWGGSLERAMQAYRQTKRLAAKELPSEAGVARLPKGIARAGRRQVPKMKDWFRKAFGIDKPQRTIPDLAMQDLIGERRQVPFGDQRIRTKLGHMVQAGVTKEGWSRLWATTQRNFWDKFVNLRYHDEKIARHTGRPLSAKESLYKEAIVQTGGTGGVIESLLMRVGEAEAKVKEANLYNHFTAFLDYKVFDRAILAVGAKRSVAQRELLQYQAEWQKIADKIKPGLKRQRGKSREQAVLQRRIDQARKRIRLHSKRLAEKKVVPKGYDRSMIAQRLKELQASMTPKERRIVTEAAKVIWDVNRVGWDAAKDSGLISKRVHQVGLSRGIEYTPLTRIITEITARNARLQGGAGSGLAVVYQKVLMELKGSDRANMDPVDATMKKVSLTINQAARNNVARMVLDHAKIDPEGFGKEIFKLKSNQKAPEGMGEIPIYVDGKRIRVAAPKMLADSMGAVTPGDYQLVSALGFDFAAKYFKLAATGANIAFGGPNAFRDFGRMYFISKAGHKVLSPRMPADLSRAVGHWGKMLIDALQKNKNYRKHLEGGHLLSTMMRAIDPEYFRSAAALKWGKNPIRWMERVVSAMEEATKMTAYERLIKKGFSHHEARWETRNFGGSPDFGQSGLYGPKIGLVWMFYNANIQGLIGNLKRLRESPTALTNVLAVATLTALAEVTWNSQFTDAYGNKEWDKVSDADKENNWVMLLPTTARSHTGEIRNNGLKIPMDHTVKMFFNPIRRAVESVIMGQKFDGGDVALQTLGDMVPGYFNLSRETWKRDLWSGTLSALNPMMRVPIEEFGNYEAFRKIPIESRALKEFAVRERYTPYTSRSVRRLSQALGAHRIGISPVRFEHMFRGFAAGLGDMGIGIADFFEPVTRGELPGFQSPGPKLTFTTSPQWMSKVPLMGPIARRFWVSALNQQEKRLLERLYRRAEKTRRHMSLINRRLEEGKEAEAMELYMKPEIQQQVQFHQTLQKVERDLSALRKDQRLITLDPYMDAKFKRSALEQLQRERYMLLESINEFIEYEGGF